MFSGYTGLQCAYTMHLSVTLQPLIIATIDLNEQNFFIAKSTKAPDSEIKKTCSRISKGRETTFEPQHSN